MTQIKTQDKDGYEACPARLRAVQAAQQPEQGTARRAVLRAPARGQATDMDDLAVGQEIKVASSSPGELVDVIGVQGRGFPGVVKRHGFRGGPKTHGQSDRWRAPGSIGSGTTPGRVFKGMRMAGRMGNDRVDGAESGSSAGGYRAQPAGGQGLGPGRDRRR